MHRPTQAHSMASSSSDIGDVQHLLGLFRAGIITAAEFTTMSRDYTLTDPERLEEAAPGVATDPRDVDDRASRSRSLSRSSSLRSGD